MKAINLQFTINTKEDFHIGTGLDCVGLYDDGQLKDSDGNPAIRSETLKGLLKQSCLEVRKISEDDYKEAFDQVFDFKNLGSLDVFVEYLKDSSTSPFIIHTFTAIDPETGKGKDGSLRDIEFGSKGCQFKCEIHFELKNDNFETKVIELLRYGIKNLKWMGGYRRRGFGAISCDNVQEIELSELAKNDVLVGTKFRILLKLKDDVCLGGAGQTGNNIHTMDYISGTTAMGMFRNILLKMNKSGLKFMDAGNVSVSNFYPTDQSSIDDQVVIPAPASLRQKKKVARYAEYYINRKKDVETLEIPPWALKAVPEGGNDRLLKDIISQDTLIDENEKDQSGASDKSISNEFIIFENADMKWQTARFYKPQKTVIMRNRISEKTQTTSDDDLFSQEMIVSGTNFMGEISFCEDEQAQTFITEYRDWLSGKYNFHVGRGAKPIELVAIKAVPDEILAIKPARNGEKEYFTITLKSDVILYDDNLMPETVIHPKHLNLENEVTLLNHIGANRIHQSFSGLAGLRRFSDRVISKGSCFYYQINESSDTEDVMNKLAILAKSGLGFKTDEGFGEILINLSVHQINKIDSAKYYYQLENSKLPAYQQNKLERSEMLHNIANKLAKEYKSKNVGINFINKIIAYMEAGYDYAVIAEEIRHGKTTSNGEKWKEFEKLYNNPEIGQNRDEIIHLIHLKLRAGKEV